MNDLGKLVEDIKDIREAISNIHERFAFQSAFTALQQEYLQHERENAVLIGRVAILEQLLSREAKPRPT
jgi:hypothetical protein